MIDQPYMLFVLNYNIISIAFVSDHKERAYNITTLKKLPKWLSPEKAIWTDPCVLLILG